MQCTLIFYGHLSNLRKKNQTSVVGFVQWSMVACRLFALFEIPFVGQEGDGDGESVEGGEHQVTKNPLQLERYAQSLRFSLEIGLNKSFA